MNEFNLSLIYALVRPAMAAYFAALLVALCVNGSQPRRRWARALWTVGCVLYLAHVIAAFQFVYHWSHAAALEETTRRTIELTGSHFRGGIYLNYLFTLIWTADVAWWWTSPTSYETRPRAIAWLVHAFMAFMVFNAVVVFGSPPAQVCGAVAILILTIVYVKWRFRRSIS